jgi:hypothetical protein
VDVDAPSVLRRVPPPVATFTGPRERKTLLCPRSRKLWAEVLGAADIFLGVNAQDRAGYPDCRPEYVESFQRMANLATKAGVEGRMRLTIHAPLIRMTKPEIIRTGLALGVDYGLTLSCYGPSPLVQYKALVWSRRAGSS